MLAKEISVPLPLLLALLPEGEFRARIRGLVPHAFALLLYCLWRWWMLGTLFGGYGWAITDMGSLIASLPIKIAAAFVGHNRAAVVVCDVRRRMRVASPTDRRRCRCLRSHRHRDRQSTALAVGVRVSLPHEPGRAGVPQPFFRHVVARSGDSASRHGGSQMAE